MRAKEILSLLATGVFVGPAKYRDMLLETGTEEMAHIEMLATAVALNLEGAPLEMEQAAKDPIVHAAWEEVGGKQAHPIPTGFPQEQENQEFNYAFLSFGKDDTVRVPEGSWSSGTSFDGKGQFKVAKMEPFGEKPNLGKAAPKSAAQAKQM